VKWERFRPIDDFEDRRGGEAPKSEMERARAALAAALILLIAAWGCIEAWAAWR
jgi:hypothetical protein